jgi:bifunctional UDP-N-acetylglucosamine pyrophosphorylase/glucosamine-1-phosphate N-acetyltransferase
VSGIVEHSDCSVEQRRNTLTNAGTYCFDWTKLAAVLPLLTTDNNQGEIYLTDTVAMLTPAMHLEVVDADETNGTNDRLQLAQCEAVLQERLRRHWMAEGVSFSDPASCAASALQWIPISSSPPSPTGCWRWVGPVCSSKT